MLGEAISEVLELQLRYSDRGTPAMQRRGSLVRDTIPSLLREAGVESGLEGGWVPFDVGVHGKDGIGRKSQVPWVRIYSASLSPSSTTGWYLVYLFAGDGGAVYLTLMHASTRPKRGELIARSVGELSERVRWGEAVLGDWLTGDSRMVRDIHLHAPRSKVAEAYETSTLCAIRYAVGRVPADESLSEDLKLMIGGLARLYDSVPR